MKKIININSFFLEKRNLRGYLLITVLLITNANFNSVYANSAYSDIIINFQENVVSGVVTDESDVPLFGVNIIVKGTAKGTQSDFDGKYTIEISEGEVLVFSYVGFKSIEYTIGESNIVNVAMKVDNQLDEVMVVAYGVSNKRSFTGAAETVHSEVVTRGATASFETALQGKVSGINISTSGQPGGKSNVQIRGIGSIIDN